MGKVFSFCNQKGGVGKTTSAVNIAALTAKHGYKTLLIDMDSQANTTSGIGMDKPSIESTSYSLIVDKIDPSTLVKKSSMKNLDIIPSNSDLAGADLELINRNRREYALREQVDLIKESYDFIFLDCPPSLGMITINSLTASDYIIIPLQCEYYALEGLGQLLHAYELVHTNLNPGLQIGWVILTMADFRTNLTQQVIEEVRNFFKDKVFETVIPRSVKISEAPSFGQPAVFYDPNNRASKSYQLVAGEFLKRFAAEKSRSKTEEHAEEKISEQGEKEDRLPQEQTETA